MKKLFGLVSIALLAVFGALLLGGKAKAQDTIYPGVTIDGVDVSGKTAEEARSLIEQHIEALKSTQVTFIAASENRVQTTFADLGVAWANPEVVDEALAIANDGNVITRYKSIKDIQVNGSELPINITFDRALVESFLNEQCAIYDTPVENATLKRENGSFVIVDGAPGIELDVAASADDILNNLYNNIKAGQTEIQLVVNETQPEGSREELSQVKDVLGTFTTSYSSSNSNRSANVANGCSLIDGTVVYPGEEFSAYDTVKPFTTDNGYYLAGSYLNGQVVESLGGGICQVSSTLYNAVLLAELEVTERNNHSMVVSYVQKSADAAIAESSGKDFRFVNNTEYPIYIEGVTANKQITFTIYGVETRPSNRRVEYVSEIISETVPETDNITADPSQPVGYVSVTASAHIGYRANLWKVVYENDEEVERVQVNSSNYSASPRCAVVGVSTPNVDYYNFMMSSIASGSVDTCKAAAAQIASLEAQNAAPVNPTEELPQ